jgi:hypothetical protein
MNNKAPTDLKAIIAELEKKKAQQEKVLINQFNLTYESLKPVNMIKSTLHEIGNSTDLKSNLMDAALGLGFGMLSKRILIGSSGNFFKKIGGALLEFGIAGIVAKNSDKIKVIGKSIINRFGGSNKARVLK